MKVLRCSTWWYSALVVLGGIALFGGAAIKAHAQVQYVQTINTIAGNGTSGYTGDNGSAIKAEISSGLRQIATDLQGNLYLTDTTNNVIRRVDAHNGVITTVAGNGTVCTTATSTKNPCGDGGAATSGQLNAPRGVAVDASGNIYIADYNDHRVRMVNAATGVISTITGTGSICTTRTGSCGDGGANSATTATLDSPTGVALDTKGNLYIYDAYDYKIRKVVLSTLAISTVAGSGSACSTTTSTTNPCGDGLSAATSSQINVGFGLVCDAAGNVYFTDTNDYRVRMIQVSTGIISTVAGTGTVGTVLASNGDGGAATSAAMDNVYNLAIDLKGNLYIADPGYNEIREVLATATGASPTFGNIVLFAGTGTALGDGGLPSKAQLNGADGIAIDPFGNIYVGDSNHARVRKISITMPLAETTVGATPAAAISFGAMVNSADVLTSAGFPTGFSEFSAGTISGCTLNSNTPAGTLCAIPFTFAPAHPGLQTAPFQLKDSSGSIFPLGLYAYGLAPAVAFAPGVMSTAAGTGTAGFSGDGGAASAALLNAATGAAIDTAGNIYIADTMNHVIRRVDGTTGKISTFAGVGGTAGYSGDNGAATSARLDAPQAVAIDATGDLFIADTGNNAIREVQAQTGQITTIAGGNGAGSSGNGSLATSAKLATPTGLAYDGTGNLYIADSGNNAIRVVNLASGIISVIAGNGTAGSSGDGGQAASAELSAPLGVFFLSPPAVQSGTSMYLSQMSAQLLIADTGNHKIRAVNLGTGTITTVAGTGTAGYTGDGGAATAATLSGPASVAGDSAGSIYIADTGNAVVREIYAGGTTITTIAGTGTSGYAGDGGPATSATLNKPAGVVLDANADFYVVDAGANALRKSAVNSGDILNFGNQGVFANSPTRVLTVSNTGNQSLTLSGINITGGYQQIPSNGKDCTSTTALATGASCNIALTFEPMTVGSFPGTVVVTDNALNGSSVQQTVQLTGAGVASTNAILSVLTGNNQVTTINSAAKIALAAQLTDANCNPLPNQSVVFTAPSSGASGTFPPSSATTTVTTDVNGIATAPTFTANNTVGTYTVSASFASAPSPAQFNLTNVLNQYTTATSLVVTPAGNSQVYGQAITLAATVSPATKNGSTVSGSVVFYDGASSLGTVAATNASASYTVVAPAIGAHSYTATYSGDLNFASSTSAASPLSVTQAVVSFSPNTLSTYYGQTSTTLQIAGQFGGSGIAVPTGNLTYTIGTNSPSAASITAGQVTLTVPATLAVGTYTISLSYPGDTNYASATGSVTLTVAQPAFTLSSGTQSLTVVQGSYSSAATLTVTPLGALTGNVVFSCTGLPLYTACVFNTPATNPANTLQFSGTGGTQTVSLSVAAQAAVSHDSHPRPWLDSRFQFAIMGIFPVILFAYRAASKRNTQFRGLQLALLSILVLGAGAVMGGCSSTYTVAPKGFTGTTSFTVHATASNGAAQTLSVSLTVQPAS